MYLVFCLHVCLCNMCVPGTREAREGPETPGVPGGCEPPHGNRETNSGPEQQAVLALSCLSTPQPGILVWI